MTRHAYLLQVEALEPARRTGFVRKVAAGHVEASGPLATVGDICEISAGRPAHAVQPSSVLAEVAAVEETHIVLIPFDQTASIFPDAKVTALPFRSQAPVGEGFAGRAVNALGEPIDGGPAILPDETSPLEGRVMAPMERQDPDKALETGVRAIDGMLTLGRGQRIGIFAASGVGKTTLMRQLAGQAACDHCVLCLVGERGREVETIWREFGQGQFGQGQFGQRQFGQAQAARRFTCVAATSDVSAALRARAVQQALCLAEFWRARGRHVVLVVDSVTRYAMALREIGLSAGAPPTLRAYTPNVFAALPRLVERCGAARSGGSLTAIITVLSETDDVDDPIVEVMKSLLDGHIILSRQLADQGHFPAIDLVRSVSRQSEQLMTASHAAAARRAVSQLAAYEEARIMIESGIYKAGSNPRVDEAVRGRETLLSFLKQKSTEHIAFADTLRRLQAGGGANA